MKKRLIALTCTAVALALPISAGAALPKPATTLIVPNKSVGGVALGAKASQVTKAWGKTATCEYSCVYEGARKGTETPSGASVLLEKKAATAPAKVWLISLHAGSKSVNDKAVPNFDTPLTRFQTAKGIGLGSKASELARAYPKAVKQNPGPAFYYEIPGPGETATTFTFSETKRIVGIGIESHPGG